MVELTIPVEGMRCGMCESHVNDAVRRAANVKKVTSSHVKGQTVVVAEDDADKEAIVAAIREQGYGVGEMTVRPYEKKGLFGLFKKK